MGAGCASAFIVGALPNEKSFFILVQKDFCFRKMQTEGWQGDIRQLGLTAKEYNVLTV